MSDHVYKIVEVVGSSPDSIEDAIRQAVAVCNESLGHLDWFEVKETRGSIQQGSVAYFQVVMRVGFRLEGPV